MRSIAFHVRRPVVVGALLVGALTVCVKAVEPGLPSKTSIVAASLRAVGAKHPDPTFRNPDDLAVKFLGPRERALLRDFPMDALDLEFRQAVERLSPQERPSVTTMFLRTTHLDAALDDALREGMRQVSILGAGFDSRGYRFRDRLQRVRFIEVDYGPTQEYKKQRVREIFGALPAGSKVVFDYTLANDPRINDPTTRFARWGEPWVFGFPGESAIGSIRQAGLVPVTDLSMFDLATRYAQRQDGTSTLPVLSGDQHSRRIGAAQVPDVVAGADETAVRRVFADFARIWDEPGMPGFETLFTEDADFVVITGRWLRGRTEIVGYHRELLLSFYAGSKSLTPTVEAVRFLNPEIAIAHIRSGATYVQDGKEATRRGLATATLVKKNGRWLISAFHNTLTSGPGALAPRPLK